MTWNMKRIPLVAGAIGLACALTSLPMSSALAKSGKGNSGNAHSQGHHRTHPSHPSHPDNNANGNFGGQSDEHISDQGRANSNGPNAVDRQFGQDRSDLRRDEHALTRDEERELTARLNARQLDYDYD
jgi:hypothetical protein